MGMGFRKGVRGIEWGTVRHIALAWLVTLPAAGVMATGAYWMLTR